MNRETAKLFLPLVAALAEGKVIEKNWHMVGWGQVSEPDFVDRPEAYRIKPEPVTRPWSKPEDVPGPVCWLRVYSGNGASETFSLKDLFIHEVNPSGVFTNRSDGMSWSWSELQSKRAQYSTDRKNWQPCTVTEESK